MKRVVLIGYDPETVDFSDPALPPGMTAAKIYAGVQATLDQMSVRGWEADLCYIRPDRTARWWNAIWQPSHMIVSSSAPASAFRPSGWNFLKRSSMRCIEPRRPRPLPSTRDLKTAPMQPADG